MKWRDFNFKGEQKPSEQAFKHMFKIIVIQFYSLFEHMPNINGHTLYQLIQYHYSNKRDRNHNENTFLISN